MPVCKLSNCNFRDCTTPLHAVASLDLAESLALRTGITFSVGNHLCQKHWNRFIKFFSAQKKCSDPFGTHKTSVKRGRKPRRLRTVNARLYDRIKLVAPKAVPGTKLCHTCCIRASLRAARQRDDNVIAQTESAVPDNGAAASTESDKPLNIQSVYNGN